MPTTGDIAATSARAASNSPRLRRGTSLRGMTLIELLVVLALLTVIGAMVVPVFTGSIASVRLRRAGDQVLTGWSRARAEAIETGEIYQFCFTPETGTFVVEPWNGMMGEESTTSTSTAAGNSSSTAASTSATSAAATSSATSTPGGLTTTSGATKGALAEEIVFQNGELAIEDAESGERSVTSLQETGAATSTPILFFPDGTASQASVLLTNGKKQFVRLTLRGLTGAGRASEVMTQEELQRADRRK